MTLKIGENIKRLRHEHGMTQERLAELLGVSCVAVSKWESASTCPDISLLIPLSEVFGVTIDELMGVQKSEREMRLCELKEEIRNAGSYDEHITAARRAVAEFPSSEELRRELFVALMRRVAVSEQPCENKRELLLEAEHLGLSLIENTKDAETRTDVTAKLINLYANGFGDAERARRLADTLPTIAYSREIIKYHAFHDEYHKNGSAAIDALVRELNSVIRNLVLNDREIAPETGISMLRTSSEIIRMIYGDDLMYRHEAIEYNEFFTAVLYLDLGKADDVLAALKTACEHAIAYDDWCAGDRGKTYDSPFVCTIAGCADETPEHNECRRLLQRLQADAFDAVRVDARFRAAVSLLEEHAR